MLEVLHKAVVVVEKREPQGRQEGVGVAGVDVGRRFLRDSLHNDLRPPDDVGVTPGLGGLLLEDGERRLGSKHFQRSNEWLYHFCF